jgi:Zn-dependent protease/predicted transcriptional regulator
MPTNSGLRIGKVLGIPIYLDFTWLFIFALIVYSFGEGFGQVHSQWPVAQRWAVAVAAALLFFGSVLFHEFAHAIVAKHYKIRVVSITLFFFGGLARIGREPSKAIQEFNIAVAGPLASFVLGGCFLGIEMLVPGNAMIADPAHQLGWINLFLGLFNLAPGFPLDGGRIFRALVWAVTKDFSRATRMAGTAGKLIAYGLIAYGSYQIMLKNWSAGWYILLGVFLLNAARESVAQVAIREALTGLSASDVMSHEVPTVSRDTSLEEYGAEVLRTGRRCHLVVTDDRLVGMMNVHALSSVPRDEWGDNSVQAVMIPRDKILWASPEEPLLRLLERLLSADINQMPVVRGTESDGAHIIGMVTRDSILRVMQTRSELGPLPATK